MFTLLPALCGLWGFKLKFSWAASNFPTDPFPLTRKQCSHTQGIVVDNVDTDFKISQVGNDRCFESCTHDKRPRG